MLTKHKRFENEKTQGRALLGRGQISFAIFPQYSAAAYAHGKQARTAE